MCYAFALPGPDATSPCCCFTEHNAAVRCPCSAAQYVILLRLHSAPCNRTPLILSCTQLCIASPLLGSTSLRFAQPLLDGAMPAPNATKPSFACALPNRPCRASPLHCLALSSHAFARRCFAFRCHAAASVHHTLPGRNSTQPCLCQTEPGTTALCCCSTKQHPVSHRKTLASPDPTQQGRTSTIQDPTLLHPRITLPSTA